MLIKKILLLTVFTASIISAASADPGKPKPTTEESPLKFNGYIDTYYFLNSLGTQSNLGASGFERVFDQKANNFQIGLAQFKTTFTKDKLTAVMDLTFGNHGDLGNYGNKFSPLGTGIGTTGLAIKQAFISYKLSSKTTLTAGQYGTHIGYEVIDAPVNYNYSLSNMFANGPFYHTGVKLDIAASDKVGFMLGIVNGLDSKDDNNKGKGIQGQISLKPNSKTAIYLNYFGSDEDAAEDTTAFKNFYDLTATLQATDKVGLGVNAVYGTYLGESWYGAALYANAALSSKFSIGTRIEYFNNKQAAPLVLGNAGANTLGLTLTGNLNISDNLKFKPEVRFDSYTNEEREFQFENKDGEGKNSLATFGGALIFYF
ncbi:MAG: porin [Leadbetterella sp.]